MGWPVEDVEHAALAVDHPELAVRRPGRSATARARGCRCAPCAGSRCVTRRRSTHGIASSRARPSACRRAAPASPIEVVDDGLRASAGSVYTFLRPDDVVPTANSDEPSTASAPTRRAARRRRPTHPLAAACGPAARRTAIASAAHAGLDRAPPVDDPIGGDACRRSASSSMTDRSTPAAVAASRLVRRRTTASGRLVGSSIEIHGVRQVVDRSMTIVGRDAGRRHGGSAAAAAPRSASSSTGDLDGAGAALAGASTPAASVDRLGDVVGHLGLGRSARDGVELGLAVDPRSTGAGCRARRRPRRRRGGVGRRRPSWPLGRLVTAAGSPSRRREARRSSSSTSAGVGLGPGACVAHSGTPSSDASGRVVEADQADLAAQREAGRVEHRGADRLHHGTHVGRRAAVVGLDEVGVLVRHPRRADAEAAQPERRRSARRRRPRPGPG